MADKKQKIQPAAHWELTDLVKRYEFLMHSTRDVILFIRYGDGKILEANTSAVNAYQYSREELLAKTIMELRAPETRSQTLKQMHAAATCGILMETIHIRKDGGRFPVEVNSQGAVIGKEHILLSVIRDITERKISEQLLQENEKNLRALFNTVSESIFLMDTKGIVLTANETIAERLKISLKKLIGSCIYDLLPPEIAKQRKTQVEHVIRTGKPIRFEDIRFSRCIDQVFYPVFGDKGDVVRIAVFGVDITERRKMEEKLEVYAFTDQLTGLYNRRGFVNLADRQLKLAKRSHHKMLLFYADLDRLKWINDHFGHEEGDKALSDTARILVQTFRESDIISRIGGDEYAVLTVNADESVSATILSRFHKFIDYINSRKSQKYKLSISIGYALFDPAHPCSIDELMSRADFSMYEDKKINKAADFNPTHFD